MHLKFDEGTLTTAQDATANNHDGTLGSGVSWVPSPWARMRWRLMAQQQALSPWLDCSARLPLHADGTRERGGLPHDTGRCAESGESSGSAPLRHGHYRLLCDQHEHLV